MKKIISVCLTLMLACSLPAAAFAHGGHHHRASAARSQCSTTACMVNGVCDGSCYGTGSCRNYAGCNSLCDGSQACINAGYCLGHNNCAGQGYCGNYHRGY